MKLIFEKSVWKRRIALGLSAVMLLAVIPAESVFAEERAEAGAPVSKTSILKAGSHPASGMSKTVDQPFASGTAGSGQFRMPSVITLDDGSLLAAADARWNAASAVGGMDTIASISVDGGNTWNYSFPFHFPDAEGYAGEHAASFTDPALVQGADGTIYCFADAFPTGYWPGDIKSNGGTGYITVEGRPRLALTDSWESCNTKPADDDETLYAYYVGDFAPVEGLETQYAPIVRRRDHEPTQYVVDEWYNIYERSGGSYTELTQRKILNADNDKDDASNVQQNVFYRDSMFHVYRIGYTWVITSKDGRTWEQPKIITDQIMRAEGEDVLLISSGRGLTTKKHGDILIGDYFYKKDGQQLAGMIYSSDNGKTWNRTKEDVRITGAVSSDHTAENEIVELKNGNLLMFYRNTTGYLCYANVIRERDGSYIIGSSVKTGAKLNDRDASDCNISAVSYSRELNGRQIILVSCPSGEAHPQNKQTGYDGCVNGRIYAFVVENNGALKLAADPFPAPDSFGTFRNSCLSELDDGSIGLLWENGSSSVRYDRFSILDIMPDSNIKGVTVHVDMETGESYEREYAGTGKPVETVKADENIVAADFGNGYLVNAPIYDHSNASTGQFEEAFLKTANTSLALSDMEMTFTKTKSDSTGDYWQIGNQDHSLFVANWSESGTRLFKASPAEMKAERINDSGLFRFSNYNPDIRYFVFYAANWRFSAQGSSYLHEDGTTEYDGEFTLFERTNDANEDSALKGYAPVQKIKCGKKYLITYVYTDAADNNAKRVVALYPESEQPNHSAQMTKLIGKNVTVEQDSNKKFVRFTAGGEGSATAVIDGVTYKIRVTDPDGPGADQNYKRIELRPNEAYLEKTNQPMTEQPKGTAADVQAVKGFDIVAPIQANEAALAATDTNLSDFEFVFTKSDRGVHNWTVYNQKNNVYLKNKYGDVMSASAQEITVEPVVYNGCSGKYRDMKNTYCFYSNDEEYPYRQLIFWAKTSGGAATGFEAYGETRDPNDYTGEAAEYYRPLMLLKKSIPFGENAQGLCLGGYVPANEIISGEKYLICFVDDAGIYLLNPGVNPGFGADLTRYAANASQTVKTENDENYISITANKIGFTSAVAGNTEYRIYVREEGTLIKEHYYLTPGNYCTINFDEEVDCTIPDSDALYMEYNGVRTRRLQNVVTGKNTDYLEKAEFTFHSMGGDDPAKSDHYQVVANKPENPSQKYLGKFGQGEGSDVEFFSTEADQCVKVEKDVSGDNNRSGFKISKVQTDMENAAALCFHVSGDASSIPDLSMHFNMTSHEVAASDDTKMTLFEKDSDPDPDAKETELPGYRRAEEVRDGGVYLIAYEWAGDETHPAGIYVLNPQNGIWNSTRLAGSDDIYAKVTQVVASPADAVFDAVSFLAGNELYTIEIENTGHTGHNHMILGGIRADCYECGFTGNEYCPEEGKIIRLGSKLAATGHTWDEGTITKPLTVNEDGYATEDGEMTFVCEKDRTPAHTKTAKIYAYAYNHLKETCVLAEEVMENIAYHPEAANKLRAAYQEKSALLSAKESDSAAYYAAGESLQKAIAEVNKEAGYVETEEVLLSETETIEMYPGDTKSLVARVLPENATNQTLIWSSSNQNTASVDGGIVTAVARGSATITVKSGKKQASVRITVKKKPIVINPNCTCTIDAIAISPQSPSIAIGVHDESGRVALAPEVSMGGACKEAGHPQNVNFSYQVKDAGSTQASVSNQGVVTARAQGTAVVTVTAVSTTSESSYSIDVAIAVEKELDKNQSRKQAIEGLEQSMREAKPMYEAKKQSYHTNGAWEKFAAAYQAAESFLGLLESEKERWSAEKIRDLTTNLVRAQQELPKKPGNNAGGGEPELPKILTVGREYRVDRAVYVALSQDTVAVKKGWNEKTVRIPATENIEGVTCRVAGIYAGAFKNMSKIRKVILGANIQSVSGKAFDKCRNLDTVTISSGVRKLSKNAFYNCGKIKKVIFQGTKLPSMKKAFNKTAKKVTVQVKKTLRNKKAKKKSLVKKMKNAGLKVKISNIK